MPTSTFDTPPIGPTPPAEMAWPTGSRAFDTPVQGDSTIVYVPTAMLFFVMRAFHTVFPTGYVYWTVPNVPDGAALLAPYPAIELNDIVVYRTLDSGGGGGGDPYRAAFLQIP